MGDQGTRSIIVGATYHAFKGVACAGSHDLYVLVDEHDPATSSLERQEMVYQRQP